MINLDWRHEEMRFGPVFGSLTIGSYYRVHPNLKIGGFYSARRGARHDDDWVAEGDGFEWRDTRSRTEHVLVADASPRFRLDFLPGESWVLMIKNRYHYNTYNTHQTVQVRPAVTYFHIIDRIPLLNLTFAYDFYLPLNFSESNLYTHYPYLTVLYHLSPVIKFDAGIAYRSVTWSTSRDVRDDSNHGMYIDTHRTFVFSFGVIVMTDI